MPLAVSTAGLILSLPAIAAATPIDAERPLHGEHARSWDVTELPPGLLRETAPLTARPLRGFDGERHGGPVDGIRPRASHDQRRHEARQEGSGHDHGRGGPGRRREEPEHPDRGPRSE
jgi:hypothetical protein